MTTERDLRPAAKAVKWTPKTIDWLSNPPPEPYKAPLVVHIHFCDSCHKEFATCESAPVFGNGRGSDNVIDCAAYEQKEVGRKCFVCGYAGSENKFRRFCAACHRGL